MILDIVIALFVGGLIGLVTNGIAIKMLFRPLRPIYIGKFRLPFTPGLIPKERPRIASAIGEIVSNDLLGVDTLKDTLLSDSMKGHFNTKIDQAISRYAQSGDTVSSLVERFVSGDTVRQKLKEGEEALALIITKKAIEQNVGKTIVDYAYEEIISKTKPILKGLTSSALNSVKQPFEKKIGEMIEEKSGPLVEKFITDQANEIWRMPLNVIIERYQDKIPQMKHYIWNVYEDIVRNRIEEVMKTLDISEVINKKINNLDLLELEKIINTLVKKELNALIWLGGLLGMVMGLFNVIFDLIS
jgi:uncharacterized membrane protein YheB (UPF0754 family)